MLRKFVDLPLGTPFRYVGGDVVWVVLEHHGYGRVARWQPVDGWVSGQSICSATDTEYGTRDLEVEPIETTDIEKCRKGYERYELVRTLTIRDFVDLYGEAMKGDNRFDDLVDKMIEERKQK